MNNREHSRTLAYAFKQLKDNDMLNPDNKQLCLKFPAYALELARAMTHDESVMEPSSAYGGPGLDRQREQAFYRLAQYNQLTEENVKLCLNNPRYAFKIGASIEVLGGASLLTLENIQDCLSRLEHSFELAHAFKNLKDNDMFNPDNKQACLDNPKYAAYFIMGFIKLKDYGLFTPENRSLCLDHPQNAHSLAEVFGILYKNGFLIPENKKACLEQIENLWQVIDPFLSLMKKNLLTQGNITACLANPQNAKELARNAIEQASNANHPSPAIENPEQKQQPEEKTRDRQFLSESALTRIMGIWQGIDSQESKFDEANQDCQPSP